ncbi:DUF1134 domain-containing protein [Phenylobacterium sp.]|uniref:DUF1134 domain-containing protein n=1 Tax=Phenylobacterium sp. TaxID=1871053 RepID=UPI0028118E5A|nr:DUF1134 domain-containing protein [Phenylobacterium sp.]
MDRRTLIATGLVALSAPALARAQSISSEPLPPAGEAPPPQATEGPPAPQPPTPTYSAGNEDKTYSQDEIVRGVSDFMGVTAETAGGVVERLFAKNGRPTGYIAGEEGSGAFVVGGRYGRGLLYMKDKEPMEVFWQGPSIGWDFGGNASRVFTLVYDLHVPEMIFQRFPGVEGSAYVVGGLGVNYQKASGVTLAPIRAGVGLRLGANVGYLAYTRKRNILPF